MPEPEEPAVRHPSLLRLMSSRRIVWSSLKLAFVVGTVLNLINNGPPWWQQHTVTFWKVLLNYLVPFCVSSYSAARHELSRRRG